jgi:hypothetical protein
MAGRYLVTGVQLGMLSAIDSKKERGEILQKIIDEQYIGNSDNDVKEDAKWHEKLFAENPRLRKK